MSDDMVKISIVHERFGSEVFVEQRGFNKNYILLQITSESILRDMRSVLKKNNVPKNRWEQLCNGSSLSKEQNNKERKD